MKRWLALAATFSLLLFGCGGGNNPVTPPATQTVKLTGTLQTTAKLQGTAATYSLVAKSKSTDAIYVAPVNGDGTFELDVPQNDSLVMDVVKVEDSDTDTVAVMVSDPTANSGEVVTGFSTGESDVDMGTFTLDEAKGTAEPQGDLSSLADSQVVARTDSNGSPVGIGNAGKGDQAQTSNADPTLPDQDKDGVIDDLDADANGNGSVDQLETTSDGSPFGSVKGAEGSECIDQVGAFMNLKIEYDKTDKIDLPTDTVVTLVVKPNPNCSSKIESVALYQMPLPSGGTVPMGAYASTATDTTTGKPWKDEGWALFKNSDGTYSVFITPNALAAAGDWFMFEINYSDGTKEVLTKAIDFVFDDIPKLTAYQGSGDASESTAPTPYSSYGPSSPITFSGDDLTLKWTRPIDGTGKSINGMTYQFEVFYFVSGTQKEQKNCAATVADDTAGTAKMEVTLTKADCLPDTTTAGDTIDYYKIDIKAQSVAGDNGAHMIYFERNAVTRS